MSISSLEKHTLHKWGPVYSANLIFSLHYALILYVNSSFLSRHFSPEAVSLLFVAGALGNIAFSFLAPDILRRIGNRKLLTTLIVIEFFALIGLTFTSSLFLIAFFFIVYGILSLMIFYSLDIFLDALTTDKRTGEVRGIYLTIGNAAIAAAPLLVAHIAPLGEFERLYLSSALLLIPLFFIAHYSFKKFHDVPNHHLKEISLPFKRWWKTADIRRVTIARFILEFFFALMVIFTPLYLREVIGFGWDTIGVMFTIMLLAFVIFDFPVGELADKKYGEKEMMTLGFFITGIALLIMPFLGPNPTAWTLTLFLSRIGACFIEVTTDVYFFKKVKRDDNGLVALFRLTRPLPVIFAAALGTLFLAHFSFTIIFFFIAIVVFLGMVESTRIKDTL